jgi:hypothetical protein
MYIIKRRQETGLRSNVRTVGLMSSARKLLFVVTNNDRHNFVLRTVIFCV